MIWLFYTITVNPFTLNIDTILRQCEKLNPYSVSPRYPDEKIINEQQMKTALTDAREVLEFCLPFYKEDNETNVT
jgi:HEPN domain-containing protein